MKFALVLLLLCIALIALWLGVTMAIHHRSTSMGDAGMIGDSFGAVNALFSAFALLGVIVTLYLQTQELRLQRQELADTRKELERSATAQEKTQELIMRQTKAVEMQMKNELEPKLDLKVALRSGKELNLDVTNLSAGAVTELELVEITPEAQKYRLPGALGYLDKVSMSFQLTHADEQISFTLKGITAAGEWRESFEIDNENRVTRTPSI